ncbi:MAG: hypothetical protein AAF433_13175 [Bacteroidota bacterium]
MRLAKHYASGVLNSLDQPVLGIASRRREQNRTNEIWEGLGLKGLAGIEPATIRMESNALPMSYEVTLTDQYRPKR